ncbi:hypothetical protein IQ216_05505 [Cyanobium sp. LEGE 06143]|nr:hypothetical protein [Cyanobium sp. LEGE 06143]
MGYPVRSSVTPPTPGRSRKMFSRSTVALLQHPPGRARLKPLLSPSRSATVALSAA